MLYFFFFCCLATIPFCKSPYLSISQPPEKALDQDVNIRVEHLESFQEIELQAEVKDEKKIVWSSKAMFCADIDGIVDVSSSTPINNSTYKDIDGMGLFWSMIPTADNAFSSFTCKNDEIIIDIKLYVSGKLSENQTLIRYLKSPDVKKIDIRDDKLVGTLFLPSSKKPLPVIITLSGSNGGLSEIRAKLLASNGFAVLALAYFGVESLPSNLQEIPLEYFENAFKWLKKQSNIDSSRVGLYGVSRGAELALILGSTFPSSVQAIVAIVPSSVVYGGLGKKTTNAWVYQNKPILPFATVSNTNFSEGKGETFENPANTRESFINGMKDIHAFLAATIPVENVNCPLLLISGGDDQMWPSDIYCQQIIDRLQRNHSRIFYQHLHYPDAGHGINIPNLPSPEPVYYHPISKLWFSMGGIRSANARASRDSWHKLVTFFHKSFENNSINMKYNNQEKFSALKKIQYNYSASFNFELQMSCFFNERILSKSNLCGSSN